jgi:membrane protein
MGLLGRCAGSKARFAKGPFSPFNPARRLLSWSRVDAMDDAPTSRWKKLFDALYAFWTEKGIEAHEEERASRLHRFAHFWLLVAKSFNRNKCPLRATALAYTTLLALVPLLALVVSITTAVLKGKGEVATRQLVERLVDAAVPQLKLMAKLPEEPTDKRTDVINQINGFIANVQTKTLGAGGGLGLILVAILLLANIEDTFNEVWGVTRGRNWFRRVIQYWATLSLGPIIVAVLAVVLSSSYSQNAQGFLEGLPIIGRFFFKSLPFIFVSLAFALLYKLIPNTPVHWSAALAGGAVGGTAWLLLNLFNAVNMSRVVGMSTIYGTALAVLPIFLVGLYFSWLIVLFGAQVAYAFQNRQVYLQERKAEGVNQRGREYIALRVMTYVVECFHRHEKPPTLLQISKVLGVPSRLVGRVLQPLLDARLLIEVSGNELAYAPSRPSEAITCQDILHTLRAGGGMELETRDDGSRARVRAEFDKISEAERRVASATTLQQMVEKGGQAQTPGTGTG